jgi:hypothetical protein
MLTKRRCKSALARKSDSIGDIGDQQIGFSQQLFGTFEPLLNQCQCTGAEG